jgi:low affinity Fe/Cu permease
MMFLTPRDDRRARAWSLPHSANCDFRFNCDPARGASAVADHRGGTTMRQLITRLGVYAASPFAFLILFGYGALWYVFTPATFDWHAGATMATWFMTLVIQRAEHRDTQAIHAKLDEMLHAQGKARNELTRIDEKEPEEIEQRREKMRRDD